MINKELTLDLTLLILLRFYNRAISQFYKYTISNARLALFNFSLIKILDTRLEVS